MIESNAFRGFSIDSISLPSSIEILKSHCFYRVLDIEKIPNKNQKNICYYEDKFILGKSDLESDVFEVLIFVKRNIENVIIPSFIKQIGQCAFKYHDKIKHVEFLPNSQLEIIDEFAFANTTIECISIPSNVTIINDYAFYGCQKLANVNFNENSKLMKIGQKSFSKALIENIKIPSNVSKIL